LNYFRVLYFALKSEPFDQVVRNGNKKLKSIIKNNIIRIIGIKFHIERSYLVPNFLVIKGWCISKWFNVKLLYSNNNNEINELALKHNRIDVLDTYLKYRKIITPGINEKIQINELEENQLQKHKHFTIVLKTIFNLKFSFQHNLVNSNSTFLPKNLLFQKPKPFKVEIFNFQIDIIIPIYNGFSYLEPLFRSIKKSKTINLNLIVINDASSDERVVPFLNEIRLEFENFILISNERNLGFVKSINKGVALTKNHFVILNSDVEVPQNCFEKLIQPIYTNPNIASVTPFTNSGTICSFPNFNTDNVIFGNGDLNTINSIFEAYFDGEYIELPTGVGFCMAINKNVVNEIDFFDEDTFVKGYGEENDWCQRALKAGYLNILLTNTYVYHKHGGSFLTKEKSQLLERNLENLSIKHPNYNSDVNTFIENNENSKLHLKLLYYLITNICKNSILLIDHNFGGGATHYREKKVTEWLANDNLVVKYLLNENIKELIVNVSYKNYKVNLDIQNWKEFEEYVYFLSPTKIVINSLVGFSNINEIKKSIINFKNTFPKLIIEYPIHDYHSICPIYVLLNQNGEFCNIPSDLTVCNKCLSKNKLMILHEDKISNWRKIWEEILIYINTITVFSNSSKELFQKAYPNINSNNILVKPHSINHIKPIKFTPIEKEITIGVLGAINFQKGSKKILDLSNWLKSNNKKNKIVVIGKLYDKSFNSKQHSNLTITGAYNRIEIESLVIKHDINVFFMPSIWPETFSYTTEEVIKMNMPICVYNLGAPAERVSRYKKGETIDLKASNNEIFNSLNRIALK